MSSREISQIAKKLLDVGIMMAETELLLNQVMNDESISPSEREIRTRNAISQLASGKAIIQNVVEELAKRMAEGSN